MSAGQWRSQSAQFGYDSVAWLLGIGVAYGARYDWELSEFLNWGVLAVVPVVLLAQILLGHATHLYRGRHDVGTIEEASALAVTVGATALVLQTVVLIPSVTLIPRSVPIPAAIIALALAAAVRLVTRVRREARTRPDPGAAQRVLVYGAGRTGEQLVRSMLSDDQAGLLPVALLDDDPRSPGDGCTACRWWAPASASPRPPRPPGRPRRRRDASRADRPRPRGREPARRDLDVGVKSVRPLGERLKPAFEVAGRPRHRRRRPARPPPGRHRRRGDRRRTSRAGGCSSPAPAARSAPSCAARSPGSARPSWSCSTATSRRCTPSSCRSTARRCSTPPDVVLADIRDREAVRRGLPERAARGRLPRRRAQAPAAARAVPRRRRWKTNVLRHPERARRGRRARRRALRQHLHRQGRRPGQRARALQADRPSGSRPGTPGAPRGQYLSVRFGNVLGSRGSVLDDASAAQIAAGAARSP